MYFPAQSQSISPQLGKNIFVLLTGFANEYETGFANAHDRTDRRGIIMRERIVLVVDGGNQDGRRIEVIAIAEKTVIYEES